MLTEAEADAEDDDEDALREVSVLLLRLMYARTHAQMQSLAQELEMLRNAPPSRPVEPSHDSRRVRQREDSDTWRLDAPVARGGPDGQGPLLDPNGKASSFLMTFA